MIVTEEEAKTKWCPMASIVIYGETSENRMEAITTGLKSNCIGSGCMSWVWFKETYAEGWAEHCPDNMKDKGFCGRERG